MNVNIGWRLCPSFKLYPHSVLEFDTPAPKSCTPPGLHVFDIEGCPPAFQPPGWPLIAHSSRVLLQQFWR